MMNLNKQSNLQLNGINYVTNQNIQQDISRRFKSSMNINNFSMPFYFNNNFTFILPLINEISPWSTKKQFQVQDSQQNLNQHGNLMMSQKARNFNLISKSSMGLSKVDKYQLEPQNPLRQQILIKNHHHLNIPSAVPGYTSDQLQNLGTPGSAYTLDSYETHSQKQHRIKQNQKHSQEEIQIFQNDTLEINEVENQAVQKQSQKQKNRSQTTSNTKRQFYRHKFHDSQSNNAQKFQHVNLVQTSLARLVVRRQSELQKLQLEKQSQINQPRSKTPLLSNQINSKIQGRQREPQIIIEKSQSDQRYKSGDITRLQENYHQMHIQSQHLSKRRFRQRNNLQQMCDGITQTDSENENESKHIQQNISQQLNKTQKLNLSHTSNFLKRIEKIPDIKLCEKRMSDMSLSEQFQSKSVQKQTPKQTSKFTQHLSHSKILTQITSQNIKLINPKDLLSNPDSQISPSYNNMTNNFMISQTPKIFSVVNLNYQPDQYLSQDLLTKTQDLSEQFKNIKFYHRNNNLSRTQVVNINDNTIGNQKFQSVAELNQSSNNQSGLI